MQENTFFENPLNIYISKQRKFKSLVKSVQRSLKSKEYKQHGYSFDEFIKKRWNISKAQAYRYLISAKVLDQLEEFDIQPSYERLCRSLYNYAKTPQQMKLLWGTILKKARSRPDCINSSHVTKIWKELYSDERYSHICNFEKEIMDKVEKSLNMYSRKMKFKQINGNGNVSDSTSTTTTTTNSTTMENDKKVIYNTPNSISSNPVIPSTTVPSETSSHQYSPLMRDAKLKTMSYNDNPTIKNTTLINQYNSQVSNIPSPILTNQYGNNMPNNMTYNNRNIQLNTPLSPVSNYSPINDENKINTYNKPTTIIYQQPTTQQPTATIPSQNPININNQPQPQQQPQPQPQLPPQANQMQQPQPVTQYKYTTNTPQPYQNYNPTNNQIQYQYTTIPQNNIQTTNSGSSTYVAINYPTSPVDIQYQQQQQQQQYINYQKPQQTIIYYKTAEQTVQPANNIVINNNGSNYYYTN
ncbi:hypothetical protein BCR32DRAFT_288824 [Anaeromyces robustus]|uniref:Uncharacterized protein n=1 Tax=Anaeromyces robustus TaxID=1754192 RepID=A0A1Y1XQM3_9FUNG|nr:hypothetical protein BCR32DRAFT_288824 [Anaeromyces robustus]|eukprot:ORX88071.1 hypothetical protein BCR32DRAFT_288824 [Anaeromyces robustus]